VFKRYSVTFNFSTIHLSFPGSSIDLHHLETVVFANQKLSFALTPTKEPIQLQS